MINTLNNILPKSGGNQLTLASVCESRNIKTSLVAFLAPAKRALIKPCLFLNRMIITVPRKCFDTKLSNGLFKLAKKSLNKLFEYC